MIAPLVNPSSAAAAKEPEAKPLFSNKNVTITNHAVIVSEKQYNLSEIEAASIEKDKWKRLSLRVSSLQQRTFMYFNHMQFFSYFGTQTYLSLFTRFS